MHTTVSTWAEFLDRWDGALNFLMEGECVPFAFDFPPLADVVDALRVDEKARITPGARGDGLNLDDISASFRALPIEVALKERFALAHFALDRFDAPGTFLHGFGDRVLRPWEEALRAQGFTWERCYPIIFISGAGCMTNYHMDFSHVLAWQIVGTKRFCGLKQPDRWAPRELRVRYDRETCRRPAGLGDDDALCYDMPPGSVLWNAFLTPHWVEASGAGAMSINISHGGLRLNGRLCPHERELQAHREANPAGAAPRY